MARPSLPSTSPSRSITPSGYAKCCRRDRTIVERGDIRPLATAMNGAYWPPVLNRSIFRIIDPLTAHQFQRAIGLNDVALAPLLAELVTEAVADGAADWCLGQMGGRLAAIGNAAGDRLQF